MNAKIRLYVYNNYQTLVGVGMGVTFGISMVPQTLGLSRYKKIVASYSKDGINIDSVDEEYVELKNKIMKRLELRDSESSNLELFTCFGLETVQSGSTKLRTGAIVGIPASFSFTSPHDVQQSPVFVGEDEKRVDWSSQAGQLLKESLVLSKEAKAFVLAREIVLSSDYSIWTFGVLRAFTLYVWYLAGRTLNNRMNLDGRMKLWARGIIYVVIGVIAMSGYITLADTYSCYRDNRADKTSARLNAVYARGGVEFYEKRLDRNRAFKAMTSGNDYTVTGNERRVWRRPHVQDSSRRDNLKKYLVEFEEMIKTQLAKDNDKAEIISS